MARDVKSLIGSLGWPVALIMFGLFAHCMAGPETFKCKRCGIVLPVTENYCGPRGGALECGFCKSCMFSVCKG